jgi:hypothetical protein
MQIFPKFLNIFHFSTNLRANAWILCTVINEFDYVFSENGLLAYKDGQFLAQQV